MKKKFLWITINPIIMSWRMQKGFMKIMPLSLIAILVSGLFLFTATQFQTTTPVYAVDTISTSEYEDSDGDGTVDRIHWTMDENVTACTYEAGDWTVNTASEMNLVITGLTCSGSDVNLYIDVTADANETGAATDPVISYADAVTTGSVTLTSGNMGAHASETNGDAAAPVVIAAVTEDTDANGKLDHLELQFTEAIEDLAINAYNATVDYNPSTLALAVVSGEAVEADEGVCANDATIDDAYLCLIFDEDAGTCDATSQAGCDTEEVDQDVTWTGASATIEDALANRAANLVTGDVVESDGAKPLLMDIDLTLTSNRNRIEFKYSEPITVSNGASSGTKGDTDTAGTVDGFGSFGTAGDVQVNTGLNTVAGSGAATITIDLADQAAGYMLTTSTTEPSGAFTPVGSSEVVDANSLQVDTSNTPTVTGGAWDLTKPTITSVTVDDAAGPDGEIDQAVVVFDTAVRDANITNADADLGSGGTTTGTFTTGSSDDATTTFNRTSDDNGVDTTASAGDFTYSGSTTLITDLAGNLLNTGTDGTIVTGDIAETDGASPVFVSASATSATNVKLVMSETIAGGTVTFGAANAWDATGITSSAAAISGADIDVTVGSIGNTAYTASDFTFVTANGGVIQDAASNATATFSSKSITDAQAPTVVSRVMLDTNTADGSAGTVDGQLDGVLVTFSEAMDASTAISTDFVMTTSADAVLTEAYTDVTDDTTLFFRVTDSAANDTADLMKSQITGVIDDMNGNAVAVDGAGVSSTDGAAPFLVSFTSSTGDGTKGPSTAINATATYSENISSGSISITLDTTGTAVLSSISTNTLSGTYTVGATGSGENSSDLTVSTITAHSAADAGANTNSGTSLPATNIADGSAIVVDTTAPVVSAIVLTPNGSNKVGDVIGISITADAAGYTNSAITVNGVAVTGFTDNTGGNYTATYTIIEGDTDRASNTTPASVVLSDAAGNTNSAFTTVTANTLSIDANTPSTTFTSITPSSGTSKVGDTVTARLTEGSSETGLTIAGTINGVVATNPQDNGDGTYDIDYVIVDGNADVSSGALATSLTLTDAAGNAPAAETTPPGNTLVIDANLPSVSAIVLTPNGSNKVGDVIGISITADAAAYTSSAITVNGVAVTGFSDNGGGNYTASYTIIEGDTDRASNTTPASVVLSDAAGNLNSAFTTVTANTLSIDANSPSVTAIVLTPNGANKVGDVIGISITADAAAYTSSAITVNGVAVTGFSDNGGGNYTASYTIIEGDTDRASNTTPASVVLSDSAGNTNSAYTTVTANTVSIDANTPILAETTPVTTPTSDATPDVSFSSDEAGAISWAGGCDSVTGAATAATQTITLDSDGGGTDLADATYNCTLTVTDAAGNASTGLALTQFVVDTTAPVLAETTPVTTPTTDTTPDVSFSSDEAGAISWAGGCDSVSGAATAATQAITLDSDGGGTGLTDATYDCTLTVTDAAGNPSTGLALTQFVVDTGDPTVNTYSPTDDAASVAIGSDLILTFDENVVVGTGDVVIYRASDDSIFETIDITGGLVVFNGTTGVTINPTSDFVNSTSYYVQVDNTAIEDSVGNTYAGIADTTTWNFMTVVAAPTYACSDGLDNDGDGLTDYPADPHCTSATDNLEAYEGGGGGGGGSAPPSNTSSNTTTTSSVASIDTITGDQSYSMPIRLAEESITYDQDNNTAAALLTAVNGTLTHKPNSGATISVYYPSNTEVTGPVSWDGKIDPPLIQSVSMISTDGEPIDGSADLLMRADVELIVKVGSVLLEFSNEVTLTIPVDLPDGSVVDLYFSMDGNTWEAYGDGVVQNGMLVLMVDHFSYFALVPTDETRAVVALLEGAVEGFTDIIGHWAEDYINQIADLGIVSGKTETSYAPNDNITRAELTKIATKAFGIEIDPDPTFTPFTDVPLTAWFAQYVIAARDAGIVEGIGDSLFAPNEPITRAAALKVVLESAGFGETAATSDFDDVPSDAWFAGYVSFASQNGVVSGYGDGTFGPGNSITRAEVAKIVVKVMEMPEPAE